MDYVHVSGVDKKTHDYERLYLQTSCSGCDGWEASDAGSYTGWADDEGTAREASGAAETCHFLIEPGYE